MNKLLLFCSLSAMVLLVGCQDGYPIQCVDEQEEMTLSSSEQRAVNEAIGFAQCLSKKNRAYYGHETEVQSVHAWLAKDMAKYTRSASIANSIDTLLYIVNFANNRGYALVAENENYAQVVAFIENGNLTPSDSLNPGMEYFLHGLTDAVLPDTAISNPPSPFFPPLFDSIPIAVYEPDWVVDTLYAPILTTKWGQGSPFNDFCFNSDSVICVAGCVAIALGQIFSAHCWPNAYGGHVYSWNDILAEGGVPVSNVGRTSVAHLIHDIGLLVYMNYGPSSSGASFQDVPYCFNAFGYNYNVINSYDFATCINDLAYNKPVYIRGTGNNTGSGHAWVIDGALVRHDPDLYGYDSQGNRIYVYQRFVHCNWGWNGNANGYFHSGVFSVMNRVLDDNGNPATNNYSINRDYSYNNKMYYNISKIQNQ